MENVHFKLRNYRQVLCFLGIIRLRSKIKMTLRNHSTNSVFANVTYIFLLRLKYANILGSNPLQFIFTLFCGSHKKFNKIFLKILRG